MTAQKKRPAVRPLARVSPTHIEAEKNVKPIMMTNMDQKERFWDSSTHDCSKSLWPAAGVLICFGGWLLVFPEWSAARRARDVSGEGGRTPSGARASPSGGGF